MGEKEEKTPTEHHIHGTLGRIEEFDRLTEDWASYRERLELYLSANRVTGDRKRDVFLTCIGKNTYGLLRALIAPDKPSETSYDDLAEALTSHLAPKKIVIAERFRFHKREQKEGESVKEYLAALQKLAEHCDFAKGLADALRDRVVCGIRDEALQRRLLAKEK